MHPKDGLNPISAECFSNLEGEIACEISSDLRQLSIGLEDLLTNLEPLNQK